MIDGLKRLQEVKMTLKILEVRPESSFVYLLGPLGRIKRQHLPCAAADVVYVAARFWAPRGAVCCSGCGYAAASDRALLPVGVTPNGLRAEDEDAWPWATCAERFPLA